MRASWGSGAGGPRARRSIVWARPQWREAALDTPPGRMLGFHLTRGRRTRLTHAPLHRSVAAAPPRALVRDMTGRRGTAAPRPR